MTGVGPLPPPLFRDRVEAGRRLGAELGDERGPDVVVVGLARGGVPVAAEVAAALGAPLDALVVRKVGHPLSSELAIGAVAAGGQSEPPLAALRRGPGDAAAAFAAAAVEADRMDRRLRDAVPSLPLEGAVCILVDDGLATGATMGAAIRAARAGGARRIVVGVPVGAVETVDALVGAADRVVCPYPLDNLLAVGLWYHDFGQVGEDEVVALIASSRGEGDGAPG